MTSKISFPTSELSAYRQRLRAGLPIITTRVSAQVGQFHENTIYTSRLGPLCVTRVQHFQDLRDHPYWDELSPEQKAQLTHYLDERGYDVITLMAVNNDISVQISA